MHATYNDDNVCVDGSSGVSDDLGNIYLALRIMWDLPWKQPHVTRGKVNVSLDVSFLNNLYTCVAFQWEDSVLESMLSYLKVETEILSLFSIIETGDLSVARITLHPAVNDSPFVDLVPQRP